jgi:hypothetical protein
MTHYLVRKRVKQPRGWSAYFSGGIRPFLQPRYRSRLVVTRSDSPANQILFAQYYQRDISLNTIKAELYTYVDLSRFANHISIWIKGHYLVSVLLEFLIQGFLKRPEPWRNRLFLHLFTLLTIREPAWSARPLRSRRNSSSACWTPE